MRRVFQAAARAVAATARAGMSAVTTTVATTAVVRGVASHTLGATVYSPAVQGPVAKGAGEVASALFTGHAYTHEPAVNAAYQASHRAQYQRNQSKRLSR